MYDAFNILGHGVSDLRFDYNSALSEQYVGIQLIRGHVKISVERFEINLMDFTPKDVEILPQYLNAVHELLVGIKPNLHYSGHQFSYYGHFEIEGTRPVEFLSGLPSPVIRAAGTSLGCGFNFLWDLPDKQWRSRLVLDHSLRHADALFIGLSIDMKELIRSYADTVREVQEYLRTILVGLDLDLPLQ
jgi:hypothetical protein